MFALSDFDEYDDNKARTTELEIFKTFYGTDYNYIIICPHCVDLWTRKRDCKTTKAVRNGLANCSDCDEELKMYKDSKQSELEQ
jgi:hypothetical protein